ncbi:unnamed protein product [Acanthoscelides obtectus]|uniref:Uncharacterized protein n=1 Tax=Acanthoscelides obtectus TaxID=200917 RepID=A0A9P0NWS8_ACAOB|nr:unnamed protein product [Acanthoscelides obtectus]CAK1633929.1 hypothetical protein AOBTE_LOCUS8490 [Acanthoscelides obtectus]
MDRPDIKRNHRSREKKPPRVPIKTYRWEDVKRARRRGGYPWTHLYKKPLSEDLDVDSYRIGGLRRGKSTSTMGDKSYLTISEMTESERDGSLSPEPMEKIDCTLQIVLEPDDESRAASAANSVVIEEYNGNGTENEKETEKDDEKERETDTQRGGLFVMDSGESSDDISQYVDKEERTPPKKEKVEKMEVEDDSAKRKRKLSAESSYSRISQTKSAIIRKLKQTKDKIKVPKVPKISLPVSKIKRPVPKKSKSSPPTVKKETQKSTIPSPKTNQTPEYIHIPLKPPPGETDEFSHLEFEPKDAPKKEEKKAGSFKALIKNIKQLQELEAQQDAKKGLDFKEEESKDLKEDVVKEDVSKTVLGTEIPTETEITEARTTPVMRGVMTKLKDEESENKDDKVVDTLGEDKKEAIEVLKDEVAVAVDKVETKDEEEVEEGDSKKAAEQDIFDDLFRKSSFKKETPSTSRMGRSKSAEPERKRKLSLESSYSRKSMSRLGIMKRLKDASEKIKDTFSRSGSKKKSKTPDKPKEAIVKEPTKKSKELKPCKPVEPVYIHIPLKPPEGETDELSHLSKDKKVKNESKDTSASPQTPDSLQTPEDPSGNVQLIILTAPSDDEVLDYNSSDLPETPSSETKTFFDKTELAMLAKDAADAVKKLDPVKEENGSEKSLEEEEKGNGSIKRKGSKKGKEKEESAKSIEGEAGIKREGSKKAGEKESKEKEVSEDESSSIREGSKKDKDKKAEVGEKVVDVEDGLSETKITQLPIPPEVPAAETTADPELKSSIKGGFGSPVMKKKVSFKRRSKSSKDGSYEDVQAPVEEKKQDAKDNENSEKLEALTPSQSMSVDEEKAYLEEKIIKHSSLEEDYNKWSKNIDHEYEPVCPPPDRASSPADHRQNLQHFPQTLSNPSVYVVDTDIIDPSILPLGEVPLDNHATVTKEPHRGQSASPDRQPTFVKFAPTEEVVAYHDEPPPQPAPGRFQQAFREKTENFKNKLHNIKRPHIKKPNIHLPDRPKFNKPNLQRFKIDKSKFHMPKIPDTTKINLPSFNLPRRQSTKSQATTPQPLKERNLSTEAHDGDAKAEKTGGFDFGTFPKMLKRIGRRRSRDQSDFGTAPRSKKSETSTQESSRWSGSESMRIPLHSEDSMDAVDRDGGPLEVGGMTPGGPLESSHARYEHDIGNEDEEEEFENSGGEFNGRVERDFHDRWQHGRFNEEEEDREFEGRYGRSQKVTDLDSPEDAPRYDFNANNRDNYSSAGSSAGIHRSGVLEEINSDEFIWRQKGISQEDVDMRRYLTSEIKEAFKTPQNALTQLDDPHGRHYDLRGSNQSLPEVGGKRKPIRKPKRKKTPHASQEKIHQYVEDSASEDVEASPPSRPRRRSKRTRKPKSEEIVPFQETHAVEVEDSRFGHRESLGGILGDDEGEDDGMTYENERMIGKEHPEIKVQDPYKNLEFEREVVQLPAAPPRKHKSLKSLTMSENGSLLGVEAEIEVIKTDSKLIIPIEPESPPSRPSRSRSRANSQSRGTSRDDESLSRRSYSAAVDSEPPCVEEPCMKEVCDYMGYSVVDKSKVRDPPLPPPRAPRKKRSTLMHEEKFFTVPRAKGSTETPVRPLRNYSTLIQAKKATDPSATENKENFHIMQYAEIDDEPHKDALSKPAGDVIKKIQDRPLPAPPRPPRRSRQESGGPLRDITSQENIASRSVEDLDKQYLDEAHTATQTEPLSDDFVCAEVSKKRLL